MPGRRSCARGRSRQILTMVVLAGASSFFVGNAFQAQMPEYAHFLGADDTGARYSILLAAHAAGAVIGVIMLESATLVQPSVRATIVFAALWALSMGLFPMTGNYPLAVLLLVVAGIFSIAFTSMAQTLVQILAPPAIRGTIVGLFNTAMLGLRAGSGITVGVLGAFRARRLHRRPAVARTVVADGDRDLVGAAGQIGGAGRPIVARPPYGALVDSAGGMKGGYQGIARMSFSSRGDRLCDDYVCAQVSASCFGCCEAVSSATGKGRWMSLEMPSRSARRALRAGRRPSA